MGELAKWRQVASKARTLATETRTFKGAQSETRRLEAMTLGLQWIVDRCLWLKKRLLYLNFSQLLCAIVCSCPRFYTTLFHVFPVSGLFFCLLHWARVPHATFGITITPCMTLHDAGCARITFPSPPSSYSLTVRKRCLQHFLLGDPLFRSSNWMKQILNGQTSGALVPSSKARSP